MGNKNRIFLGIISEVIFHHIRNTFNSKKLYITKLKSKRIAKKHAEIIHYIYSHNFQLLIDNTIATCDYSEDGLYNFIAKIDNDYILYSISQNNYYNELGTLFYIRKKQMAKCYESIGFLNERYKEDFLREIN